MRISENYWNYRNYIVTYVRVRTSLFRTIARFTIVRLFYISFVLRSYDRSCLRIRSLVFTIARALRTIACAYDRSCVRSPVLTIARAYDRSDRSCVRTIARAYDRSCVRSLVIVLTIARAYDRSDRSCLRSIVLTIARAYGHYCVPRGN